MLSWCSTAPMHGTAKYASTCSWWFQQNVPTTSPWLDPERRQARGEPARSVVGVGEGDPPSVVAAPGHDLAVAVDPPPVLEQLGDGQGVVLHRALRPRRALPVSRTGAEPASLRATGRPAARRCGHRRRVGVEEAVGVGDGRRPGRSTTRTWPWVRAPMATRTCEGSPLVDAHDEPEWTANPAASSSRDERLAVDVQRRRRDDAGVGVGERTVDLDVGDHAPAAGRAGGDGRPRGPSARPALESTATWSATAAAATDGTSSWPGRRRRCRSSPSWTATTRPRGPCARNPTPRGPPNFAALAVSRSAPRSSIDSPSCPTRLAGVDVQQRADRAAPPAPPRRPVGACRPRGWRAGGGPRGCRSVSVAATASGSTAPDRSTSTTSTSNPWSVRSRSQAASTAECSTAETTTWRRVPPASASARAVPRTARCTASVPPEVHVSASVAAPTAAAVAAVARSRSSARGASLGVRAGGVPDRDRRRVGPRRRRLRVGAARRRRDRGRSGWARAHPTTGQGPHLRARRGGRPTDPVSP